MKKYLIGKFLKVLAGGAAITLGALVAVGASYDVGMAAGVDGVCRIIAKNVEAGNDMTLSEFAEKYGGKE